MDKSLVKTLLPVVNNPDNKNALLKYVEYRINYHKDALTSVSNMDDVKLHQGAIRELSRIFTLQEEVRQKAEEYKDG